MMMPVVVAVLLAVDGMVSYRAAVWTLYIQMLPCCPLAGNGGLGIVAIGKRGGGMLTRYACFPHLTVQR